ncbi:CBS domain-containing protein, partial [Brucella pinnipedialis M163/99/10]
MAEQTLHPPSAGYNRGETQDSEGQSTQRSSVTEKRSLLSNI